MLVSLAIQPLYLLSKRHIPPQKKLHFPFNKPQKIVTSDTFETEIQYYAIKTRYLPVHGRSENLLPLQHLQDEFAPLLLQVVGVEARRKLYAAKLHPHLVTHPHKGQ